MAETVLAVFLLFVLGCFVLLLLFIVVSMIVEMITDIDMYGNTEDWVEKKWTTWKKARRDKRKAKETAAGKPEYVFDMHIQFTQETLDALTPEHKAFMQAMVTAQNWRMSRETNSKGKTIAPHVLNNTRISLMHYEYLTNLDNAGLKRPDAVATKSLGQMDKWQVKALEKATRTEMADKTYRYLQDRGASMDDLDTASAIIAVATDYSCEWQGLDKSW